MLVHLFQSRTPKISAPVANAPLTPSSNITCGEGGIGKLVKKKIE